MCSQLDTAGIERLREIKEHMETGLEQPDRSDWRALVLLPHTPAGWPQEDFSKCSICCHYYFSGDEEFC